jgi:hypothetical protein
MVVAGELDGEVAGEADPYKQEGCPNGRAGGPKPYRHPLRGFQIGG